MRNWRKSLGVLILAFLVAIPGTGVADKQGEQIFKQHCGRCHQLPDPGKPPPEGWPKRLDLMARVAKLNAEQKADVLEFLQSHSQTAVKTASLADEKRLFEEKCSLCHTLDRVFLTPLTGKSRRHIVSRMQKKAPDWISEEQAEQILDYINKAPTPDIDRQAMQDTAEIFRTRCVACHTLERVYLKLESGNTTDWMHIVERMQNKAPRWVTGKEASQIVEYLEALQHKQAD